MFHSGNDCFSANCCNLCSMETKQNRPSVQHYLLMCNGCKIIQYCSVNHQKLDWPMHRELCCAIQFILKATKNSNPLQLTGPNTDYKTFHQNIIILKNRLTIILKRPLERHEEELTSFPRICNVCFTYKVKQELRCYNCNAVNYCSEEHKSSDVIEHKKLCSDLKLCYFYVNTNETDLPLATIFKRIILDLRDRKDVIDALEGMTTTNLKFIRDPKSTDSYRKFVHASSFSCVLTILDMIETLQINQRLCGNHLTFFIVGSTNDFVYFDHMHIRCILSQLNVQNLTFFFIGPEVTRKSPIITEYDWNGIKRLIQIYSIELKFEDFIAAQKHIMPNIIISFNCGFGEKTSHSPALWYNGVFTMLRYVNTPIIFTSYTQREGRMDRNFVRDIACKHRDDFELHTVVPLKRNRFHDCVPYRNWERIDDADPIFYRNGYIQAVQTTQKIKKYRGVREDIKEDLSGLVKDESAQV